MSTESGIAPSKDETKTKDSMEILEEALVVCGFGKFNIVLLAATLCTGFAAMIITTTSAYILPIAECDLKMDIMQKGLLNAIPFFGQVGASLFTGFVLDVFGRRVFLIGGNFALFILTILEGSSQNYWMLVVVKLIQGIPLSFCFTAVTPMLTEMTSMKIRDRIVLMNACFVSLSLIVAALMSWAMLPLQIDIVIWKGYFELHAWNVYLYTCSVWSLMGGILFYILPESPKYLLSHGQENEALVVLKNIYRINTGKDEDTFPIKSLNQKNTYSETVKRSLKEQLVRATHDIKELYRQPLLCRLILFTFIGFVCLWNYTSLRLWFPQLSTIVEDYHREHNDSADFCYMINNYKADSIEGPISRNITEPTICVPKISGPETYINGILMGVIFLIFVCISACVIDRVGQKVLMVITLTAACACSSSIYWANTSIQIAFLISTTCALMQTFLSLLQNVLIRVFPTTVRALATSMFMMIGRLGSLLGSILFPVLLEVGCMAPFLSLSIVCICVTCLIYFLPDPNKENNGAGDN
ncbi:synaptic vesicle glycoprotein 2C-like [Aricia agestis]|uniref:synaptic vesicle glycoprotein 2C-like n=1 Tax=Aricia agestis TaxID=91739 RepID=UPI001C202174|nr:synaptic vesicle glycoprotein 2C-like [Aricia agestis]